MKVIAEMSDELRVVLEDIRARLIKTAGSPTLQPVPLWRGPIREDRPARPAEAAVKASMPEAVALGQRQALAAFLGVLDGHIEGTWDNHVALDHRNEGRGEECWTRFHPADIRNMVNDAARAVGIPEFVKPKWPREDNPGGIPE